MRRWIGSSVLAIGLGAGICHGAVQNSITEAHVDSKGRVHIRLANGVEKLIRLEKGQVGSDGIQIAADGSAVGWLVEVPNCCTSYPIPLEIRIYFVHGTRRQFGDGMMVCEWKFMDGGRRVAYNTDTVHGNFEPQCLLVYTATGKTLQHWERGDGPLPDWAQGFADSVGSLIQEGP
jgi:hypothetical protein